MSGRPEQPSFDFGPEPRSEPEPTPDQGGPAGDGSAPPGRGAPSRRPSGTVRRPKPSPDGSPVASRRPAAGRGRSGVGRPSTSGTEAGEVGEVGEVGADGLAAPLRVVRVRPDVAGIDKLFDYTVPAALDDDVRVGTVVRVSLHGRRVGGWVVDDHVVPPEGVHLQPLAKVTGWGPPPELIDLADWAAWRWAGRPVSLLRTASPDTAVRGLPRVPSRATVPTTTVAVGDVAALAAEALARPVSVVRLAPATDPYALVAAAAERGPALVLTPSARAARHLALRLRRAGTPVASMPRDWAVARAGGATVVGTRAAAWAPLAQPAAVVVLDEHDESLQQEQAPTWHARDIALERARRAGVPCVLVSPTPSLEALAAGELLVPSRQAERAGWPRVEVVDTRDLAGAEARYSPRLAEVLRSDARVVCILNRKGRSRLLACASCGEVGACERCQAAVTQDADADLVCGRCGERRPTVCVRCGGTRFRNLRAGVTRAREELEALARRPVVELTAEVELGPEGPAAGVVVGTEAALHELPSADVVVFLDLDQELLAPRYRAAEEALGLLARAARLLGGRDRPGRLLLQTRLPDHEVVRAALLADPARVAAAEHERRAVLGFPPATAMAVVSGPSAEPFAAGLAALDAAGLELMGPADGRWLVRAPDHDVLCAALAAVPRPPGRLRVEVDPLRL